MEFWGSFIVTAVGAMIGASIGGLFAYLIAKTSFSQSNRQEGVRCLELLRMALASTVGSCNTLKKLIEDCANFKEDPDSFFRLISENYQEAVPAMGLFRRMWMRHQEQVWGLGHRIICRKRTDREKYQRVAGELGNACKSIEKMQRIVKRIQKKYKEATASAGSASTMQNEGQLQFLNDNTLLFAAVAKQIEDLSAALYVLNKEM